jgi:hypothetical protein
MKLQIFIPIHAVMPTARGAESQSWLLPPANPASTNSYSVKTGTNTTAHTNPSMNKAVAPPALSVAPSISLYW